MISSIIKVSKTRMSASHICKTLVRSFSSREKEFLVINSVGIDRPGIVSGITKHVVDAGGSIGASQAAKLGAHFGLMMLVSVPKNQSASLQKSLANVDDMSTVCYVTTDPKTVNIQPQSGCKLGDNWMHFSYKSMLCDLMAFYDISIKTLGISGYRVPTILESSMKLQLFSRNID